MTNADQRLGAWLESRLVSVESGFAHAIRAALPAGADNVPMTDGAETFSAAAAAGLRDLLLEGCEERASAAKLLVIDALATYACEALAYSTDDIARCAESMMREVASVLPDGDDAA